MSRPLSQYCFLKGGTGFPDKYQGNTEGEIPFIKVSDMSSPENKRYIKKSKHYVSSVVARSIGANVFPAGAIVFAKVGAALLLNRRRILSQLTIIDNNMMAAVPYSIDSEYLYHFLCSIDFSTIVQDGALPSINQEQVGAISLPEMDETNRKKIASILSGIETTIEKSEDLIAKYQHIKTGLMQDLFTRGVLPNGQLRPPREEAPELYQETAIGWIPNDWSIRSLQDLCCEDITYGIVQAGPHVEGGIPYIRTGDMSGEEIEIEKLLRTTPLIANSYKRSAIHADEIVMAIRATVGTVFLVSEELDGTNLTQGTARIAPNETMNSVYLLWALKENTFRNSLLAEIKGTTFAEITLTALRELPVKFPISSIEQVQIAKRLNSCEAMIKKETRSLANLHHLKLGLMQDLLTGKVPVNVDAPVKAHA